MKNILIGAGTIALRLAKVGATQTAMSKIQESNRKDIKDMTDLERIQELKERKLKFKIVKNEEGIVETEMIEKKSFGTKAKETGKVIGFGAANLLKIGAKQQAYHSLNQLNRDEMNQMHGEMARYAKYTVSPKLKKITKIEA